MMKKVSGLITFIGSIITLVMFIINLDLDIEDTPFDVLLLFLGIHVLCISAIYYTVATKFWIQSGSKIDILNAENDILKKQIEQKELLKKLESLNENKTSE